MAEKALPGQNKFRCEKVGVTRVQIVRALIHVNEASWTLSPNIFLWLCHNLSRQEV